jgi:hypothetical protein
MTSAKDALNMTLRHCRVHSPVAVVGLARSLSSSSIRGCGLAAMRAFSNVATASVERAKSLVSSCPDPKSDEGYRVSWEGCPLFIASREGQRLTTFKPRPQVEHLRRGSIIMIDLQQPTTAFYDFDTLRYDLRHRRDGRLPERTPKHGGSGR